MKIIVLGAGVIGVSTAYYLAKRGHEVAVIDRQSGPGLETSFANGGQISAGFAEPWATPGTPFQALKWLGRSDAPLLFRLRADPALWSWSLRFLANCLPGRSRLNARRMLRVSLYSRQALAELREETAIQYDQISKGILHLYESHQEFERALKRTGLTPGLASGLDAKGCVALEPALAAAEAALAGGIHIAEDESGDAHVFTARLAEICADLGVEFRYGAAIKRIDAEGGEISGVETGKGRWSADAYVLALGSYSPLLAKPLGLRLPIYPAKGYSATITIEAPEKAPSISLTQDQLKLVYSRLGNRLRVAGTAEFTGYDDSINEPRARVIVDAALKLFPGCGDGEKAVLWAGLRPKTPDSAPIIGATKYPNLFLNTGHGTLGWTMACGSSRALADLISGGQPEIDMNGLGLERFL